MGNGGTGANFKGNGRTDANPSINFGPVRDRPVNALNADHPTI